MANDIRVLHLSTHDEECGIAMFQESVVDSMGASQTIINEFFPISPNKLKRLKGAALKQALKQLFNQLKEFDILHIQHEYSFFNDDQLQRVVDGAKRSGKKVLFTMHTPPHARKEHYDSKAFGLHPRSWVHALRIMRNHRRFVATHIKPLYKADVVIVLSNASQRSFAEYGVPEAKMKIISLPVPAVNKTKKTTEISDELHRQKGDVILSMVGFISKAKGFMHAVKALTFLPDNYKLAIIGGTHPSGQNDAFYDKICDTINALNLHDRIYITGYIEDDGTRDALVRETDISLYPYDRHYYDYVSSAALNNAVANARPIVAYRNDTFEETNAVVPFLNFCQSPNYYELARTIQQIDMKKSAELAEEFAAKFTVSKQAKLFAETYQELAG